MPITAPLHGVTLDSIANVPATVNALLKMEQVPTTRIVFDEFVPARDYLQAATQIREVSYVMGEILDSYYVKDYSVAAYLDRTREYLNVLGDKVDLWEVGNEINGEWLGTTADVTRKMTGAYDIVKAQGKTAALTLYYNQDCWENPKNEMFTWARDNIPQSMKQGLDYVLISYYEDDCNGARPDWPRVFARLHEMFPNSKIGFGEIGTQQADRKADYITRYYGMKIDVPNYVGGYFWWYFKQDMVPVNAPLLKVLNEAIATATKPAAERIALTSTNWRTVYDGYGSVVFNTAGEAVLAPKVSTSPSETHAALILANRPAARNFKLKVTAMTEQQLRLNTPPNSWETLWIFFNYVPTQAGKKTNYFALKTNGVELGTAYDAVGQSFLYTGATNATAIGKLNLYEIEKVGNRVVVSLNGEKVTDYTGAVVDEPGQIGLYTEDARVRVTDVQLTVLP